MNDLSGIARHLRVSVDQIRKAAELLEQGYSPTFIDQYRGDETNQLSRSLIWRLKFELERLQRLEAARQRALRQLPKDSALDSEAQNALAAATSCHAIDIALRCFRARRSMEQSQERDGATGKLLESMLSYSGPPIEDLTQWVIAQVADAQVAEGQVAEGQVAEGQVADDQIAEGQVAVGQVDEGEVVGDRPRAEAGNNKASGTQLLAQVSRLVSLLIQGDTALNSRLRQAIQRNATLRVKEISHRSEIESKPALGTLVLAETAGGIATDDAGAVTGAAALGNQNQDADEPEESGLMPLQAGTAEQMAIAGEASEDTAVSGGQQYSNGTDVGPGELADHIDSVSSSEDIASEDIATEDIATEDIATEDEQHAGESAADGTKPSSAKSPAKLTPRQRRRRWLISVLSPMRSLKKPLHKLSAYQQLMLGRGTRSQLIETPLEYDSRPLIDMIRNTFTNTQHPLADWFNNCAREVFEQGLKSRLEADAIGELEERAAESLMEHSVDDLRQQLMRRPVRGHTIALIDTVGPKSVSVAIVDSKGAVLACEELPCSVLPEVVNQSVVRLGEWIHRHRVTLVAITNGPARRFMVVTLKELMAQSKDSGLRWTMADRSGAEAYAGGSIGLSELSTYNRRQRAAIWVARCLQDPLVELLKVDFNRLRLGSYQRELPQEPLRQLIEETIADCVCRRGLDTQNASERELQLIPGIEARTAEQIARLARQGAMTSRKQLMSEISDWSEQDKRHAIGWLRIFGGAEPLDATLIHPDEYHLAQRLIEHSPLSAPPSAPQGWSRRVLQADNSQAAESSAGIPSAAAEALSSEPSLSADLEDSVATVVDEGSSADAIVGQTEDQAEPSSGQVLAAEEQTKETNAESSEMGNAEMQPETAPLVAFGDTKTASQKAGQTASESAISPEYSEQIVAQPPSQLLLDIEKLANQWQVGRAKLKMVAGALEDPFKDPRLSGIPVPMPSELPTLETLQPEDCVWAVVVGVADFGAFVELGPNCNGLIHISRLSPQFIEDPHQCVQVGDLLMTWVVSIDKKRNRVALTALSPEQRAEMQAEAELRKAKAEEERNRGYQNRQAGGFDRRQKGHAGSSAGGGNDAGRGGHSRTQAARGGQVASGQGSSGQGSSGQGSSGQGSSGQSRVGNQAGGTRRNENRGGRGGKFDGGKARGGQRRDEGQRSKTVVIQSKQPKKPITQAMKVGEEPLRSFSDLMQFYEAKRTDDVKVVDAANSQGPDSGSPDTNTKSAVSQSPDQVGSTTVGTIGQPDSAQQDSPQPDSAQQDS